MNGNDDNNNARKRKAGDGADPFITPTLEEPMLGGDQQPAVGPTAVASGATESSHATKSPGMLEFDALYSNRDRKKPLPPKPFGTNGETPDLFVIHEQMRGDGLGDLIKDGKENDPVYMGFIFLYVRGVPAYMTVKGFEKAAFFQKILEPQSEQQQRLFAIANLDHDHGFASCPEDWSPKYPFTDCQELRPWMNGAQHHGEDDFFLIFGPNFEPNQAVQGSKNCYLPAAITAHAYAVKRGLSQTGNGNGTNDQREVKKVDMHQYIHHAFSPKQLYGRIMHNKGGKALAVFNDLSIFEDEHNNLELVARSVVDDNKYIKYLKSYGAGLVTKFHVDEDFKAESKFSYTGQVTINDNKDTGHAMVLVGARKDASGQWWLLLQNWWATKQFVQVSLEYFKTSQSVVYFPMQRHTGVREPFVVTDCNFTDMDDFDDDGGDDDDDEEDDFDED